MRTVQMHFCAIMDASSESRRTNSIVSEPSCIDKEVLVVFNNRRRPVKFKYFETDPSENYLNLLCAVERAFCDVLTPEEGSSNSESGFYLQIQSDEWGGVIDVTPETRVDDHSTVFICKPKSHHDFNDDSIGADYASEKVATYVTSYTDK